MDELTQAQIANGEVNATISPANPSPIITFLEDLAPPPGVTARQLAEAEAQEAWLEAGLIRGSKAMGITDTYLNKVRCPSPRSDTPVLRHPSTVGM